LRALDANVPAPARATGSDAKRARLGPTRSAREFESTNKDELKPWREMSEEAKTRILVLLASTSAS
jgi:hypothetical protein